VDRVGSERLVADGDEVVEIEEESTGRLSDVPRDLAGVGPIAGE